MDANKDQANRCIEIAEISIKFDDYAKAEKFLLKAERLFPTPKAKKLLDEVLVKLNSSGSNGNQSRGGQTESKEGVRQRKTSDPGQTEPSYTVEQLEAVRKVKKCKDYYEILCVTKESTDSEIKKSYKRLALLLHPDKNKAPGASDAFKSVGNAAAILTDPEKRKHYDLHGLPDAHHNHAGHGGMRGNAYYADGYGYARNFQADISAEELFSMFFGGAYPQQNYMRQQRRRQQREERENQNGSSALINLLPILLLIGLSMMSSFFISDPIYNLSPSHKYSVRRETNNLKIPYYVKDSFYSEYQGSVGRLEEAVEDDFINHLKHACSRERNYRDSMLGKARTFGDRDLYRKAQNIHMPSCDNLQKYLNP